MKLIGMSSPTVVIGLAGASFPALNTLMEDGGLPFLKDWTASAVRAGLQYPTPLSEAAAWTSLSTSRSPGAHGIFDLFRRQSPGSTQLRTLTSRDLACEALWSYLNREERRTTIFEYPLTVPPPRIEGHVVPGSWATARQLKMGCHPSDLAKRLEDAGAVRMESLAMQWPGQDSLAWIQGQIEREENLFCALRHLRETEPSDLTFALMRGFGAVQNLYAERADIREKCRDYFRALDGHLSELSRSGVTLVLLSEPASDAGFSTNEWLAAYGYLSWVDGRVPAPPERKVLDTDQLNRQTKAIDWNRTKAFAPHANNNQIYIVSADDHEFRDRLTEELKAKPFISRVWTREELFAGPHVDLAPDLVLQKQGDSEGVFLASGPHLRRGVTLPALSVLDVAPLLLYGLGLAIPGEMEGHVPEEAVDADWLKSSPIRVAAKLTEPVAEERVLDPEAETIVFKRLQDLGYLE